MRALSAKLKGPWLFVQYIEQFAKNHVRKNEGQPYLIKIKTIEQNISPCSKNEKMSKNMKSHRKYSEIGVQLEILLLLFFFF